jgi:predicted ATPase
MQLVGRSPELDLLAAFARGQAPARLAVIHGEAGIGKTALWSAAVEEARADERGVLVARPAPPDRSSSYAGLDDLLRPALRGLPQLAAAQRRALGAALGREDEGVTPDPGLVALAVRSLVELTPDPVLLAVDDWQWLDPASALVLRLVAHDSGTSTRVIATARSGEDDEAIAALLRSVPGDETLELAPRPLGREELRELVRARSGGDPSPQQLRRVHEHSRGVPLVALELMWAAARTPAATDARPLLAARLGALGEPAWEVLRATAALARPTPTAVQAAVGAAARPGLTDALVSGVLDLDGRRLRFAHPLMAEVVATETAPAAWRDLHRRLADVADDPEQRARHLAEAAEGPDDSGG